MVRAVCGRVAVSDSLPRGRERAKCVVGRSKGEQQQPRRSSHAFAVRPCRVSKCSPQKTPPRTQRSVAR
eukprot:4074929-Pyramimonas_sp.AAC.1